MIKKSDLYNEVALCGDAIYTSTDNVNVLYPHGRGPSEWNNHFPGVKRRKPNQTIEEYLHDCVYEMVCHQRPGWLSRCTTITIRTKPDRGCYHWTAWGSK